MKLLLVSVKSEVSKGGIAVWTNMFLSKCPEYDIECELVNTEVVGKRLQKGVFLINLKDEFVRTRRIFKDLKCAIKNNRFDVAHLNTSCGTFGLFRDYIVARKIKRKRIPLVIHFHCDIPFWIHNAISKKCLKMLVGLSDRRLVLCESSYRYLKNNFNVESEKIPNFVNEEIVLTHPKTIKDSVEKVFFVGRVERKKGIAEIYELAKRFPNISFRLAGHPDEEVSTWDKPRNVELLGALPHDRVIEEMDAADLFLFPSYSEGFSLALTEAMARGLPCIATDVGANADMLADECGMITAVGDVDDMEISVGKMENASVRYKVSGRSVDKVKKCYTISSIINRLKEGYGALT